MPKIRVSFIKIVSHGTHFFVPNLQDTFREVVLLYHCILKEAKIQINNTNITSRHAIIANQIYKMSVGVDIIESIEHFIKRT